MVKAAADSMEKAVEMSRDSARIMTERQLKVAAIKSAIKNHSIAKAAADAQMQAEEKRAAEKKERKKAGNSRRQEDFAIDTRGVGRSAAQSARDKANAHLATMIDSMTVVPPDHGTKGNSMKNGNEAAGNRATMIVVQQIKDSNATGAKHSGKKEKKGLVEERTRVTIIGRSKAEVDTIVDYWKKAKREEKLYSSSVQYDLVRLFQIEKSKDGVETYHWPSMSARIKDFVSERKKKRSPPAKKKNSFDDVKSGIESNLFEK